VIASLAKELDALAVAVVTKPFQLRRVAADETGGRGAGQAGSIVDTVICHSQRPAAGAGAARDQLLRRVQDGGRPAAAGGTGHQRHHRDAGADQPRFSDIKATMIGMGYAMMGTAVGRGEKAAVEAARQAISCRY